MNIFSDLAANRGNTKGQLIMLAFRIAHLATKNRLIFILWIPYLLFYRIMVEWVLGCELPYKTRIGKGLTLYHGQSLVVNRGSVIGENCTLRHNTTIGNKLLADNTLSECPVVGNNVELGANVCIIGPITIGDNVKVGAGSVVVKDVPANSTVVGNPARIINSLK